MLLLLVLGISTSLAARAVPKKGKKVDHRKLASAPQAAASGASSAAGWFERVSETQSAQPHWITPLVTVTPRLEQEYRFDFSRQVHADGSATQVYGGGKGLELIPSSRLELVLGVPAYTAAQRSGQPSGFGDTPFLLKYRLLAANERQGNYILTFFCGVSVPTAPAHLGTGYTILTPTLAFGKGLGPFDVQTTLGVGRPTGALHQLGAPVTSNTAFQYRLLKKLWPELEVNSTFWPNGENAGKKQIFLTPGLVLGRLPLVRRLGLTFGAGVQIAVTQFRTYNHNWIFSLRLPF